MSRNRKNQTAAIRFGPALKALSLCIFLAGSGVGYVWQKEQINRLGERLKKTELRYQQLRRDNDRLKNIEGAMRSPTEIEARIKEMNLGLVQTDQIVRLVEAPAETELAKQQPELLCAAPDSDLWTNP
jgi:hypothetical protein